MPPRLTTRTIELRRVVVTGMGTVNPLGNDVATTWNALLKGSSGIARVEGFSTDDCSAKIAGQLKGFDPLTVMDKKEVRRLDPYLQFSMAAAVEAIRDSGFEVTEDEADRTGVLVGSGIAGLMTMLDNCETLLTRGPMKISPFFVPSAIANMASGLISIRYGARGPNSCVVTACTTGTHAIGDAARIIQRGDADVMIAGGGEAPVNRLGLGGFGTMRALSTRNDDPEPMPISPPKDRPRRTAQISAPAATGKQATGRFGSKRSASAMPHTRSASTRTSGTEFRGRGSGDRGESDQ